MIPHSTMKNIIVL